MSTMTPAMMNLRLALLSGVSSRCRREGWPALPAGFVLPDPAAALLVLARLLSSEIIFVVGLGDAQGTGQGELGDVVLVEGADVLVVGLFGLGLGLGDGQVVGDAGVEALLGFAEFFVGEVDIGLGCFDEFGSGLNVEDAVADVLVDLLDLVGEPGGGLLVLGEGDLFLTFGAGDLQDGDVDLARGGVGAVGVAGGLYRCRRSCR